jgi:hypothetical protein
MPRNPFYHIDLRVRSFAEVTDFYRAFLPAIPLITRSFLKIRMATASKSCTAKRDYLEVLFCQRRLAIRA